MSAVKEQGASPAFQVMDVHDISTPSGSFELLEMRRSDQTVQLDIAMPKGTRNVSVEMDGQFIVCSTSQEARMLEIDTGFVLQARVAAQVSSFLGLISCTF